MYFTDWKYIKGSIEARNIINRKTDRQTDTYKVTLQDITLILISNYEHFSIRFQELHHVEKMGTKQENGNRVRQIELNRNTTENKTIFYTKKCYK
jgi:hypothetical protein